MRCLCEGEFERGGFLYRPAACRTFERNADEQDNRDDLIGAPVGMTVVTDIHDVLLCRVGGFQCTPAPHTIVTRFSRGTLLADGARVMDDLSASIAEAIQRGYVIRRRGDGLAWKLYHAWCVRHAQPFVYIDLPKFHKGQTGASVTIDLFTTRTANRTVTRFTPVAEAEQLLATYPRVTDSSCPRPPTLTPITIQRVGLSVEHAEELAQALLALYRRMKETNARTR